ncbi:hypothetical protein N7507_005186 [Penicillium longicatenatum]|nr:hypothetical protein N7507_005186 [Penicillium longicatenatum]
MHDGFEFSIGACDGAADYSEERTATIRERTGALTLTHVSVTPDVEHTWYSSAGNNTYQLSWAVYITDYIAKLAIVSITEKQLLFSPTILEIAYEVYVTFIGVFLSAGVAGCAMVEIVG